MPSRRPCCSTGDEQPVQSDPSSEHSNVASVSSAAKENDASALALGDAGPESVVRGGMATVHVALAGVGSIARTGRFARTSNRCSPSARPDSACGAEQGAKVPPSSEHSKTASSRSDENASVASRSGVVEEGASPRFVSGVVPSKTSTSSGAPSLILLRLLIVCSSPTPFSSASAITKPSFDPTYWSRTCGVTGHSRSPSADGSAAACPAAAGWFAQVTPASVQAPPACRTTIVRRSFAEETSTRRIAEATLVHAAGSTGSGKWSSARELLPVCDFTLSVESFPKLFVGLPSLTQLSRSTKKTCGFVGHGPPAPAGASGSSKTRTSSGGRSVPFSREWKDCWPASLSAASRMRKPCAPFAYIASVCARTFHSRRSSPDSAVVAGPVVVGWLLQVTSSSPQADDSRSASSVRPSVAAEECSPRVAATSLQPGGVGGRAKWTSARSLTPGFEPTRRIESVPRFALAELSPTQVS